MRSDSVKSGIERAPHRALLRALGVSNSDFKKPFIGIVNSFNEIVPGHIHLNQIAQAVKEGVRSAGGVPFEVNTIHLFKSDLKPTGAEYTPLVTVRIGGARMRFLAVVEQESGIWQ